MKKKMKEKMNKVWSMAKTLVGTEQSAGAVIQRCSVNKVFRKVVQFLMKLQALRPATSLKSDFGKGVFLYILQSF